MAVVLNPGLDILLDVVFSRSSTAVDSWTVVNKVLCLADTGKMHHLSLQAFELHKINTDPQQKNK